MNDPDQDFFEALKDMARGGMAGAVPEARKCEDLRELALWFRQAAVCAGSIWRSARKADDA